MAITNPQAQKGVDKRGKPLQGLISGKATELGMFFKVKPGHEEVIRKAIYDFVTDPARNSSTAESANAKIGLSEVRFVLFDDDQRLFMRMTFDRDWDTYVDGIASAGIGSLGSILRHTVEAPEGIAEGKVARTSEALKDFFNSVRTTAAGLAVTYGDLTVADRLTNHRIRQAFDQVLKHPDAAEALQHPALKPLLELAAA